MEYNHQAAVDKASGIGALEAVVEERFAPTTFAFSLRASHIRFEFDHIANCFQEENSVVSEC